MTECRTTGYRRNWCSPFTAKGKDQVEATLNPHPSSPASHEVTGNARVLIQRILSDQQALAMAIGGLAEQQTRLDRQLAAAATLLGQAGDVPTAILPSGVHPPTDDAG